MGNITVNASINVYNIVLESLSRTVKAEEEGRRRT
jgi:hypothetical protein